MRVDARGATIALGLGVLTSGSATAGPGVVELNQACAVRTGCAPLDAPGFPVTLSAAAGLSFVLTSDLVVPDADTGAIEIVSDDVSLDLGGYAIRGPNTCSAATPTTCRLARSGRGIVGELSISGVAVRDGSVSGMGSSGIDLFNQGTTVSHADPRQRGLRRDPQPGRDSGQRGGTNGATGFLASGGTACSLLRNHALSNGRHGIRATGPCLIHDCVASRNGQAGIELGFSPSSIIGSSMYQNRGSGIVSSSGALVAGSSSTHNEGAGIDLDDGGLVVRSVSRGNDGTGVFVGSGGNVDSSSIASNGSNGIVADGGSVLQGNTSFDNARDGVLGLSTSLLPKNVIRENGRSESVLRQSRPLHPARHWVRRPRYAAHHGPERLGPRPGQRRSQPGIGVDRAWGPSQRERGRRNRDRRWNHRR